MPRKSRCIDSRLMESFFEILKNEVFYGNEQEFRTFKDLYMATGRYVNRHTNEMIKNK